MRTHIPVVWLVVTALALSGCRGTKTTRGPGVVLIGSVNSLSGTAASSGTDVQDGEALAVQIINGKDATLRLPLPGGSGLPGLRGAKMKLVTEDDQGSPDTAGQAVTELVTEEHVTSLVGGFASGVTLHDAETAERLHIPFVNGSSSATVLTNSGFKWFFRVGPSDASFAATMFGLLQQEGKDGEQIGRIAILHTDDTYGDGVEAVTKAAAKDAGDIVVADVPYDETTTDLTPEILRIKAAHPDVLFDSSYTSDAIFLMRGMQSLGWYPNALLAYGAGFSDPIFLPTLGMAADGVMSRAAWSAEIAKPQTQAVAAMFQQEFHQPMTENSARGFSSVMALAVAINDAMSTDPIAIRKALEDLNIPGNDLIEPWARIRFDADHQNIGAQGIVQQVQGGRYQIVYPPQYAVAKAVWPFATGRLPRLGAGSAAP